MSITLGHIVKCLGIAERLCPYPRPILQDGRATGAHLSSQVATLTPSLLRRARLTLAAYLEDPTGDYWARPAHRPRRDPKAARVVRSYRLHPDTIRAIDAEAKRTGESAGQVVDRLARDLVE